MYIARDQPRKDGEERISKEEFENLVEISSRISSEIHWRTKEIIYLKIQSIQIPEQRLILNYKNEGIIDLSFPGSFCDEFFIELNQICLSLGAALFDFNFNKIPKEKYSHFLTKKYTQKKKYAFGTFENDRHTEWLGIYGGSKKEIEDFFRLIESDSLEWNEAINRRGKTSKIAMTPSLNGWIFLHDHISSLSIMNEFFEPANNKIPYAQAMIKTTNKISRRFHKAIYYSSSTKYSGGSSFYSQDGALIHGNYWSEQFDEDFGDKSFFSKVFKNNQFDFTRSGFAVSPQDLLYSKEVLKLIDTFEIPEYKI